MVDSVERDLYREEFITALKDAGFAEVGQNGGGCWRGRIWAEWFDANTGRNETAGHWVIIGLPDGLPLVAPIVFVEERLRPSWHLIPGNPQALCLWEADHGWQPESTVKDLLDRINEWFAHYHTGIWPPNSLTPDPHRFAEVRRLGVIVMGEKWHPDPEASAGSFLFWHHHHVEEVPALLAVTRSGPNGSEEPWDDVLGPALGLSRDQGQRRNLARNSPGVWFRVPEAFIPPNKLEALLSSIDRLTGQAAGWARSKCRESLPTRYKSLVHGFGIAVGYPQGGEERWLFLWCAFPNKREQNYPWESHLQEIDLWAFETGPARRSDLLRRSAYVSAALADKCVAIFGLGALGSPLALLLAKCGVGQLRLVDYDVVMPGNVSRHACGFYAVGVAKTAAVRSEIRQHQPYCSVHALPSLRVSGDIATVIGDCDLVIDATANPNYSIWLSQVCSEQSRPIMVVTTYRRARVGRLVFCTSKGDPCAACHTYSEAFRSASDYPIIPPAPDEESFQEDGCGQPTQEAVALDVETIANLVARMAIRTLKGETLEGNVCHLVNEPVPGTDGLLGHPGISWAKRTPLRECPICKGQGVL